MIENSKSIFGMKMLQKKKKKERKQKRPQAKPGDQYISRNS